MDIVVPLQLFDITLIFYLTKVETKHTAKNSRLLQNNLLSKMNNGLIIAKIKNAANTFCNQITPAEARVKSGRAYGIEVLDQLRDHAAEVRAVALSFFGKVDAFLQQLALLIGESRHTVGNRIQR